MLYCGCVFCVCIALVFFVNGPVLYDGWLLVLWSFIYLLLILMCSINVVLQFFFVSVCRVLFCLFCSPSGGLMPMDGPAGGSRRHCALSIGWDSTQHKETVLCRCSALVQSG